MPPRALRKLQRQQEKSRLAELEKSAKAAGENSESSEEDTQPAGKRQLSSFALLSENLDESQDVDPEELANESASTNEGDQQVDNDQAQQPKETNVTQSKTKKKKKRKRNKRATELKLADTGLPQESNAPDDGLDEIDRALKELRAKNEQQGPEQDCVTVPSQLQIFYQLLSVDSKNLKVLNEMKRLFGSSVLDGDEDAPGGARRRGRGPQQLDLGAALHRRNNPLSRGQGLSERVLRKNIFIQGKDGWLRETGGGLGMEIVEHAEDFTTEYRYVHGAAYRRSQQEFDMTVGSMDPQQVIQFLHFNPYHISGLLQVSEIAKQHQEPAVAVDLLERALFSFGRASHSSFSTAMTEGKARLDFRRPENRELWLAGWRYVRSLGQRGTWRTAYEWAKLLFSIDPEGDPYQVRLVLDQLAIRAGQFEQLVQLAAVDEKILSWGQSLPNIRISLALAHSRLGHGMESRVILADAVQRFPWVIAQLLKELDIDRIPKSVWGCTPRTSREQLHAGAYTARAKDIWNTPEAVSLLVEVAETTEALSTLPPNDETPVDLSEARHILLDETPALIGLLPRHYTTMETTSSDPLPPEDSLPWDYDNEAGAPELSDSDASGSNSNAEEDASVGGLRGWASRMMAAWGGSAPPPNEGPARNEGARSVRDRARENAAIAEQQLLAEQEDAELVEALRQSQREFEARQQQRQAEQEQHQEQEQEPHEQATASTSHASQSPEPVADVDFTPHDPQREQRWLAGRGLQELKAFCAEYGADDDQWGFGLSDQRAGPVAQFARRARELPPHQRRFIIEFAVPQGAGLEAGALIKRLVQR